MKRLLSKFATALAVAVGLMATAVPTWATPLPPGSVMVPVGGDLPAGGTILADTGLVAYAFGGINTGTVEEIVVRDTGAHAGFSTNPFALTTPGALSFIYQVHVTGGDIARLTGTSFGAFLTDVINGSPVTAPPATFITTGVTAALNADRAADGSVVGFNFVPHILPDGGTVDTSVELTIRTNATLFGPGLIGLIDGGGDTKIGYAPVPEPASIVMLGFGAIGMIGYGWKRRKVTA